MIEQQTVDLRESPLPPVCEDDALTADQWTTLLAIVDTVIPSIGISDEPSNKLTLTVSEYASTYEQVKAALPEGTDASVVERYLAESASSNPNFKPLAQRILSEYVRTDARKGILLLLSALNTRAGCLLLTQSLTPFHLHPVNVRQQIIIGWLNSYIPSLRMGAKQLTVLSKVIWAKTSVSLPKVLGFPRVPVHGNRGKGYDFEFVQFPPGDAPEIIDTDVVIVGSGCGGGVCAKNLAEAGHRVIVVEKAYHFSPEHLPMTEMHGSIHLFQNGGNESSDDNSIQVVAGQAWGGGGTINWSASLQTQAYVRQEWADGGLPFFTSSEFQDCLDRVCRRMGVSAEHIEHNKTNQALLEGGRKLGYTVKAVPQNSGGTKHYCGYCTFGCGSCEKQGPAVSFLPDAHRAGARFIEGFDASRVLFETVNGKKSASGVQGVWRSRDSHGGVGRKGDTTVRGVVIRARRVILSCGTLQSPLLLLRSGLNNPHIGRNLHLHPCSVVAATFPEPLRPWEGGILTSVVTSLENFDGAGHGPKLEALTMMPSIFLPFPPWTGGAEYKALAARVSHTAAFIALTRDRDAGRVWPDPHDGKCRIAYTPSAHTRALALEGILALAKIVYAAGASEITTVTAGVPAFTRDVEEGGGVSSADATGRRPVDRGINDPRFQAWLSLVRAKGLPSPDTTFGSAHQMGTCRMSAGPRAGVVDPEGAVWGTTGLYVADASVFPSASGVNPMVTNMAIADWISGGVARGLRLEGRRREGRL